MKRFMIAVFNIVLALVISIPAAAGDGPGHTISLNYLMSDWNSEGTEADQNYIPHMTGVFMFTEQWGMGIEYMKSGSNTANDGTTVESTRFVYNVRYEIAPGVGYLTLGYHEFKNDLVVANLGAAIDVKGIRVGGGMLFPFEGSPWSGGIDLGYGIGDDGSVSLLGASTDVNADSYDATLKFSYQFSEQGLLGNIGYNIVSASFTNTAGNQITIKSKGPFIGIGYKFD